LLGQFRQRPSLWSCRSNGLLLFERLQFSPLIDNGRLGPRLVGLELLDRLFVPDDLLSEYHLPGAALRSLRATDRIATAIEMLESSAGWVAGQGGTRWWESCGRQARGHSSINFDSPGTAVKRNSPFACLP
jgi:hypothetical protein